MEFSRRGPTNGGAGDGHRFPDPPAHGEREPMLVMRDALLSRLHMACLRQEIIEAELAKIERDIALCAATGGHLTQTTLMPMPLHGVATTDSGRSQPRLVSTKQPMAQQNAEFDGHKLPDPNKDALLSQLHMARLRREVIKDELAKIERDIALCAATGGHLTQTTLMPMPLHGVATTDSGRSRACPFSAEQPVVQQSAEFDDHKLPDSNRVQGTSEQNLHQHCAGQKHLSNIGTLDPETKASNQKAKMAAEPSLGTEENKTSSIKWSCSTCQAKGTSQSTLEAHLKGKRHQQNIVAATNVEGDKNGIPKNVVAQEAEPRSINVPKLSEKPPSVWSCSMCEVICTCQTDLKNHLKGIRHRERVQSLLEQSKNKASDSESRKSKLIPDTRWICSICHTHCTCESDLENHLAGRRHQLNIQLLREKIKQENNNPPQLPINKEPASELNCLMCEAKCNSKSQFEAHCKSSRHQQRIHAILSNDNIAKGSSSRTKSEVPSDGSNSKNAREKAVNQPTLYFCEVCNLLCESSTMLVHHRFGKKHRAKLSARNELS